MAENDISKDFDFGIRDTQVYGDYKNADAFLSDTAVDDLVEVNAADEQAKADAAKKVADAKVVADAAAKAAGTQAPTKKEGTELADSFFESDNEEEEEDDESEEQGGTKATVKKPETKDGGETTTDDKSGGDSKLNQFQAIAKQLYKSGVFSTEEGEDETNLKLPTTGEEFLEKFNEEKQKGATEWLENFLGKFGEDRQDLFKSIFIEGVDPKDYIPAFNQIQNLENVDLSVKASQENVVREYYTRLGWDKDKIEKKIVKLEDYSDLEDEAKTVHPQLVAQDKKKIEDITIQKQKERLQEQQLDTDYKTALQKTLSEKIKAKDLDGLPINQKQADKVADFLYTKKWKAPSGELLTDFDKFILETKKPENIATRIKIGLLAQSNFDFSKIEKKAISNKSGGLFDELTFKDSKKSNTTKTDRTTADNGGW